MNESNVIKLLTIANNDLPAVEDIYELLKRKEGELEGKIRNSTMIFQDLNNQISSMHSIVDSIRLDIEKEKKRLHQLYQKRIKQEALVLNCEQLCRYIEIFSFFLSLFFLSYRSNIDSRMGNNSSCWSFNLKNSLNNLYTSE